MYRIGFIDKIGEFHSMVHRVQSQGDAVRYWIRSRKPDVSRIGDGIVAKTHSLNGVLEFHPDVVVCYASPDEYAQLRAARVPVIGSSAFTEQLEHDRAYAARVAEQHGLTTSVTQEFTSLDEALRYTADSPIEGWVVKTEGSGQDCATTKVCPTRDHTRLALMAGVKGERFILQEVVRGVEVSTQGFFDYRRGWLRPFDSTLERKRLMSGDPPDVSEPGVGPNTGSMGSVVWPWRGQSPRLSREVLLGHTDFLTRHAVVAPFDVNAIIGRCSRCGEDHDPDVPHWLEYTPRFGWDAFEATMIGLPERGLANWLVAWGQGECDTVPYLAGADACYFAVLGIMVQRRAGVPFIAPWRSNPHVFLKDVYYDSRAHVLRSAGTETDCGMTAVFELARVGRDVWDATRPIYKRLVPNIVGDGLIYRDDLGEQAQRDVFRLAELGYDLPGQVELKVAGVPTAMPPIAVDHDTRSA